MKNWYYTQMTELPNPAKIYWGCYRGMLELDLLLIPFFEQHYDALSDQDKLLFQQLLETPDPQLFAWLMGHESTENADFARLIKQIKLSKNPA